MMMQNLAAYFSSLSHAERKKLVENHAKEIATWVIKGDGYTLLVLKITSISIRLNLNLQLIWCLLYKYGIARSSKNLGKHRLYYSMKLPAKKIEKIEKHVIEFEIPELEKQAKEATKIKEAQENFLKCVLGDELWDAIFGNN